MKKSAIVMAAVILIGLMGAGSAYAANLPSSPMPEVTPEFLDKGKEVYTQRCTFCHGLMGDGGGPAADFLEPRPRDFTLATFKFRTTISGNLPTDNDLFRTVSRGLQGTAMQSFDDAVIKSGLTEEQRWQVIAYVKTFSPEFADPKLDPVKNNKVINIPTNLPKMTPGIIEKGKKIFEKVKCWECHGKTGRGDGQSGEKKFKKNDWGFPIRIRNVTQAWKIRAGSEVEDIYFRLTTGITGTPMPSFVKALPKDEDRWAIANYVKSLQRERTVQQVLKVAKIEGPIPDDPLDKVWDKAQPMDMRMAGQVIAAPRWQNPAIDTIRVKSITNGADIAFQIEWDDPFKDVIHKKEKEFDVNAIREIGNYNSYVRLGENGGPAPEIARGVETFRDSVALQFPVKQQVGTKKPHFFRGESSNQVYLLQWFADLAEAGKPAVIEENVRGWKQNPRAQKEDQQQTTSKAVWDQGRWTMVMKRPLKTGDKNDIQFEAGKFIPMSANVWDGSNGEHGLIMSLSTWHFLFIDAPMPMTVYVYTLLGVVLTGGIGFKLMRKAEAEGPGDSA